MVSLILASFARKKGNHFKSPSQIYGGVLGCWEFFNLPVNQIKTEKVSDRQRMTTRSGSQFGFVLFCFFYRQKCVLCMCYLLPLVGLSCQPFFPIPSGIFSQWYHVSTTTVAISEITPLIFPSF